MVHRSSVPRTVEEIICILSVSCTPTAKPLPHLASWPTVRRGDVIWLSRNHDVGGAFWVSFCPDIGIMAGRNADNILLHTLLFVCVALNATIPDRFAATPHDRLLLHLAQGQSCWWQGNRGVFSRGVHNDLETRAKVRLGYGGTQGVEPAYQEECFTGNGYGTPIRKTIPLKRRALRVWPTVWRD